MGGVLAGVRVGAAGACECASWRAACSTSRRIHSVARGAVPAGLRLRGETRSHGHPRLRARVPAHSGYGGDDALQPSLLIVKMSWVTSPFKARIWYNKLCTEAAPAAALAMRSPLERQSISAPTGENSYTEGEHGCHEPLGGFEQRGGWRGEAKGAARTSMLKA